MLVAVFTDSIIHIQDIDAREYTLINGKKTSSVRCCGYCAYDKHPGFLNKKIMQKHNCIDKGCFWLYDIIDLDKLEKRESIKKDKKKLKEERRMIEYNLKNCQESIDDYEGIKLTKIVRNSIDSWIVYYIAICSVDEKKIAERIQSILQGRIDLEKENYDFDLSALLIYGKVS